MEEFIYFGGWFERYRARLGRRYETMKAALNLVLGHGGRNIVETGSLRDPTNWGGDGCSTLIFSEFAATYGMHLWTCDNDPRVIETAIQVTKSYSSSVTYVCSDSVGFLLHFDNPIDLLFLDSFDCSPTGDASAAQSHNLNELIAAFPQFGERGIVLLDDNHWENGGKTKRSKAYLRSAVWRCVMYSWQSLWISPCSRRNTTLVQLDWTESRHPRKEQHNDS